VGEILGLDASRYLDDLLSQGLIYCDPSRELNVWRPSQSALLALGLRSYTDIPALKELEEWFDTKEEFRGIAKLDPFFEKTSKLASRRLKRELERRGTLGEPFALDRIPHLRGSPPRNATLIFSGVMGWMLRSPTTSSRRRALCRAARPKGAPLGPGKGVFPAAFWGQEHWRACDPALTISLRNLSDRSFRSSVSRRENRAPPG